MLHFGWDVSTRFIGCCCMDDAARVVLIEVIDLSDIAGGLVAKMCPAAGAVVSFIDRARAFRPGEVERHAVEERLKNMVGRTNKDTLLALAGINAVVTHVIIMACGGDHTVIQHFHPTRVKSVVGLRVPRGADKKTETVRFVMSRYPEFPYRLNSKGKNPVDGTYDMADAYITALCSLRWRERAAEGLPAHPGAGEAPARKARKVRARLPVPEL